MCEWSDMSVIVVLWVHNIVQVVIVVLWVHNIAGGSDCCFMGT
jgi:hypothetical protein